MAAQPMSTVSCAMFIMAREVIAFSAINRTDSSNDHDNDGSMHNEL